MQLILKRELKLDIEVLSQTISCETNTGDSGEVASVVYITFEAKQLNNTCSINCGTADWMDNSTSKATVLCNNYSLCLDMLQSGCQVHQHPGDSEGRRAEAPPDSGQRHWRQGDTSHSLAIDLCVYCLVGFSDVCLMKMSGLD